MIGNQKWVGWTFTAGLTALAVISIAYLVLHEPSGLPAGRAGGEAESAQGSGETSERQVIRIGLAPWGDAEIVTGVAERILEERMGYEVESMIADIGIVYQGLADQNIDAMLMNWQPLTHQNYWDRFSGQVVNLGPIYTRARLGWAVPDFIPQEQLSSMDDLGRSEVQRKLDYRIQGIDPGSGLMQASEAAMEVYGLQRMELISASEAGMTAALERAIRRNEWIVVTAWNPHWIFAKHDLRYLKDPKEAFGANERVHALVRQGFDADFPVEIVDFFTRMYIPLSDLETAYLKSTQTSVDQAVDDFLKKHAERVDYWVTGELAGD